MSFWRSTPRRRFPLVTPTNWVPGTYRRWGVSVASACIPPPHQAAPRRQRRHSDLPARLLDHQIGSCISKEGIKGCSPEKAGDLDSAGGMGLNSTCVAFGSLPSTK